MTFSADEKTTHDAEPIELYRFEGSGSVYVYCSGDYDYSFNGDLYLASPITRAAIEDGADANRNALRLTMPASMDLIQDYAFDVAPRSLELKLFRIHPFSGNFTTYWRGPVTSMTVEGRMASIRVPSILEEAAESTVPSVNYQRQCNHILYDGRCGLAAASYKVSKNIDSISADGLTLTITTTIGAANLYRGGEIVRSTDSERRLIVASTTTTVTIAWPFRTLAAADAVEIYQGCDHTIETCDAKFSNSANFGGAPFIPTNDIYRSGINRV